MKKGIITLSALLMVSAGFSQEVEEEEGDTTKMTFGKMEVLIVDHENHNKVDWDDTIEVTPKEDRHNEAHWAGIDFGFNVLMNDNFDNSFASNPYLKNDVAKSQVWNINIIEHKFKVVKEYVGITTGLGFSFTQVGLRNNYVLNNIQDSTFAIMDTVNSYSKNKLKAAYITVPLLLEFNTNKNNDKGVYLAAGVVGGYRIASKYKRVSEVNGDRVKTVNKDSYNLNPFKLDATARLGYGDFGFFASYSLLPLFETAATQEAYPLNVGVSLNF